MEIEIRFRTWKQGLPPQPAKLKIPGWAGHDHQYVVPQPWQCLPFLEGATFGLDLLYPFDKECKVSMQDGEIKFESDLEDLPFEAFAPGHYGYTSALDIIPPPGHVIRLEPHPRYFTDETWTTPLAVPGHIQSEWWPRIFFVVFKSPPPGHVHIFKKNMPYAQILIVPKKVTYDIYPMDAAEAQDRANMEALISKLDGKLAEHSWVDNTGNGFNDKYKVMARLFAKGGEQAVKDYINETDCPR